MLYKLRIAAPDLRTGRSAAGAIGELAAPEPLAVTLFEDKAPAFVVEAYYAAEPALSPIVGVLAALGIDTGQPALEPVPDENWVALSQAALPPVVADRFVVHGSHDRGRFAARRTALEIDAGEAFGTGHNATTALCLETIAHLSRQRSFKRVIDLGCGTGVLAIASARTFARARVAAVDNDPIATAVARDNVRRNRVAQRVRVLTAAGFDHAALRGASTADLVLANILPGPLIQLAPKIRQALRPGGVAVLSGLLDHQAREVRAVYAIAGFQLLRRRSRDGWIMLALVRSKDRRAVMP